MRFKDIRAAESDAALDALATICRRFLDDDPAGDKRPAPQREQYETTLKACEDMLGRPHTTLPIPWEDMQRLGFIVQVARDELLKRQRRAAEFRRLNS